MCLNSKFKIPLPTEPTVSNHNKLKIEAQIMTKRKALPAGMKVGCEKHVIIPPTFDNGVTGAGGLVPPDVPIKQLKKRSILLAKVNR